MRGRTGLVLVGLMVAAAACTKAGSSPPATTPATTPVTTTPAATATVPSTASARTEEAATSARAGCGRSATVFFAALADPSQAIGAASSREQAERLGRDVEALRREIPEPLRADYETVAGAYTKAAADVGSSAAGPGSLVTDRNTVQEILRRLDDPAVKAAQGRVRSYFESCLTDLGP